MTEGDCSHDSQAVAWVLGTLSAEETERFAAHLATCETCAPLVARIREVVDVLPDSVPQEVPPAELRARIMSAVEAEANLFRAAEVGPWPEPARARKRTPGALVVGVVVVSLLAVGVLVGSALTSNKRNGEPRPAVRTTTGPVTDAGGGGWRPSRCDRARQHVAARTHRHRAAASGQGLPSLGDSPRVGADSYGGVVLDPANGRHQGQPAEPHRRRAGHRHG